MVSLNDLGVHVVFGTALLPQCCPSPSLVHPPRIPVCPSHSATGTLLLLICGQPCHHLCPHAGLKVGAVSLVGDTCVSSHVQGV